MSETYRVVTQGLKEGFSSELATERLVALFKSTKERIQPLLESNDVVVKKGLSHLSATQYKDALERCGCHCRVEPERAAAAATGVRDIAVARLSGTDGDRKPSPAQQTTPPASSEAGPISEQQVQTIIPRLHRQSANDTDAQSRADLDAAVEHRLTGDLAISFTFKANGTDANITYRMLDALHMTASELCTLANDNLYALLHPALAFKQMRLAKPGAENDANAIRFFNYVETGGSMEASCILLAPIWASVKHLLVGPLRIVIPTPNICMFCGADDAITFRMMCDIARDLKAEAGVSGLSDMIYTVNEAGRLSVVAQASDPGNLTLSHARLREIQPNLLASDQSPDDGKRNASMQVLADQLQSGDSRAAVVVNAEDGIVAAYADELDCVALLKFDQRIARTKGWQVGTRLLTVNGYAGKEQGIASDLVLGPNYLGNFGNFRPLIADLLTDDLAHLEHLKAQISEDEWSRALQMGKQALAGNIVKPRDGRPLYCATPAKAEPKVTVQSKTAVQRNATAKKPEPAVTVTYRDLAKALAVMLVCFWLVWLGVSHFRSMPVDLSYFMAWFGILFFAVVGVQYGRVAARCWSLLAGSR
jgi:hypothetical protein